LLTIYKHRKASWLINDGVCDGFTHTESSMRDNSTYGLNFRQKFRQTVIMTHQSRRPRRNKKKRGVADGDVHPAELNLVCTVSSHKLLLLKWAQRLWSLSPFPVDQWMKRSAPQRHTLCWHGNEARENRANASLPSMRARSIRNEMEFGIETVPWWKWKTSGSLLHTKRDRRADFVRCNVWSEGIHQGANQRKAVDWSHSLDEKNVAHD